VGRTRVQRELNRQRACCCHGLLQCFLIAVGSGERPLGDCIYTIFVDAAFLMMTKKAHGDPLRIWRILLREVRVRSTY